MSVDSWAINRISMKYKYVPHTQLDYMINQLPVLRFSQNFILKRLSLYSDLQ